MFGWIKKWLTRKSSKESTSVDASIKPQQLQQPEPPTPPSIDFNKRVPLEKEKKSIQAPKKRRRFHLGLDWGTSATKLVIRDYGQGEMGTGFVIKLESNDESYRYPSIVQIENGHVFFGAQAELIKKKTSSHPYLSLKSMVVQPDQFKSLAAGSQTFSYEDLATLYLAHVIALGKKTADNLAKQINQDAVMGLTLGVPAEELEKSNVCDSYLRIIKIAYEIAIRLNTDPQGVAEKKAFELLTTSKKNILSTTPTASTVNYSQWLRPELAAAMLWGFKSPAIEPDLYTCVDIGAWTTNASYFRIHGSSVAGEHMEKTSISFYGGACRPPAMNEVCRLISEYLNQESFENLRGQENTLLNAKVPYEVVEPVVAEIYATWKKGFHAAYRKEALQSRWDNLKVMTIGGGSKVDYVRKKFGTFPMPGNNWRDPSFIHNIGVPIDLFHLPSNGITARNRFDGDFSFLPVAYGLSVHAGDFPDITLSNDVEDFRPDPPPKRFRTSEELGYSEK